MPWACTHEEFSEIAVVRETGRRPRRRMVTDGDVGDGRLGHQLVDQVRVGGDGSDDESVAQGLDPGVAVPRCDPRTGEAQLHTELFGDGAVELMQGRPQHGSAVAEVVDDTVTAEPRLSDSASFSTRRVEKPSR